MNKLYVNNTIINADQITKINYSLKYTENRSELIHASPFLVFSIDSKFPSLSKKFIRRDGLWEEGALSKEDYDKLDKVDKSKILIEPLYEVSGSVKVFIELSSATKIETEILNFERLKVFDNLNRDKTTFPIREVKEGNKFYPDEVDIDFVYNTLFKNTKNTHKKEI